MRLKIVGIVLLAFLVAPGAAPAQMGAFKRLKKAVEEAAEQTDADRKRRKAAEAERATRSRRAAEDAEAARKIEQLGINPNPDDLPAVSSPGYGRARNTAYAGYSQSFIMIKALMLSGDFAGAAAHYDRKEAKVRKSTKNKDDYVRKAGFLHFAERGSLDLVRGDFGQSIESYDSAERALELRNDESKSKEKSKAFFGKALGAVTRKDEHAPYYGVGFERVLMLNGKTIAFLLEGNRRAYNVTRRSIDWQNTEKASFDAERRRAEEDLEKKKGNPLFAPVEKALWAAYAPMEEKANSVPSAFVNPFGYYVAGMIQEFESAQDPSLVGNARISYGKALELNPNSAVIRQAYEAMKKGEKAGTRRLIHVVAFDGFTPEKKVFEYQLPLPGMILPVKLPVYEPVPSQASGLRITNAKGKKIAALSPVADVSAISLRHQSDQRSKQTLDVLLQIGQSYGERRAAGNNAFGQLVVGVRERMATPDMRSWMSLPASISAARFYAPAGAKTIQIESLDGRGRALTSRTVELSKEGPTFVFVRSLDSQMQAYANQGLWFN